jgi:hypothetical protein
MKKLWEQGGTGLGLWRILRDPIVPGMAENWHDHAARMPTTGHGTTAVFAACKNPERTARSLIGETTNTATV